MAVIRYRFLDRSSSQSPFHHIFDPTYAYCTDTSREIQGNVCSKDRICLRVDMEIEHKNNINYLYWIRYALMQNGMHISSINPITVDPQSVVLYITIHNQNEKNSIHTWKIPLIGSELIFATSVLRNGYWRIMYTFSFKDNIGNTYIGNAYDDFSESSSNAWECQGYMFPDAYVTFTGSDAPIDTIPSICPSSSCTVVP